MSLKFASNLSFMFTEATAITERYKLAKEAGFKAVESGFPFGYSVKDVSEARKKADIEQILINVYTGDVTKGELGYAAIPGEEENFKKSIDLTVEYAKALNCSRIHVMSGKVNQPNAVNDKVYLNNLLYAVEKFQKENILGLIEPINNITVPNYYMNSFQKGHIQIAQVPHRHEPNTPGEINYKYILSTLEQEGYNGYIGLEYSPKLSSREGLGWIQEFGYKL
ncbi:hydroxypyruvate isomerase-like protein Gip isoform X2 [Megachile rotundata]|uniref:hydroxypyruvate isomerase-like protein Gip isoform X2 n=1 Tax=Megachile rotundata TaxID=143995 RepID=UPI003FD2F0EB